MNFPFWPRLRSELSELYLVKTPHSHWKARSTKELCIQSCFFSTCRNDISRNGSNITTVPRNIPIPPRALRNPSPKYLNNRLDIDPRFNSTEVSLAFSGCEELEIEAWQAEYGTSDFKTLNLFESVRGVKRAKPTRSVGAMYFQWLEVCMTSAIGNVVEPFWVRKWKRDTISGLVGISR